MRRYILYKSKAQILALALALVSFGVFSQTSKDNYTGLWNDSNSWVGGTIPNSANPQNSVYIDGFITLQGNLTFSKNNVNLYVRDTLIINGDLTLGNNNDLSIFDGGVLIVTGSVFVANQVNIAGNGYFIVYGDFNKTGSSNQGSFTSDDSPSNVFIGGTIDVPEGWADDDPGDVFNCTETGYVGTGCNWGNFDDILEDPIYEDLIEGSCSTKPVIDTQPTDVTASEGSIVTFSLTTSSTPVRYMWQIKENGGTVWSNIYNDGPYSGATTASLTVNSITTGMDGDHFRCIVKFDNGCSTKSDEATLTVGVGCSISLTSDAVTENQTICFNIAIQEITYSTTGATGATFSGLPNGVSGSWSADVVTLSGTPTEAGTFNYTVTLNSPCTPIAEGTIAITPAPIATVTVDPSGSACAGGNLSISLSLTGTDPYSFNLVSVQGGTEEVLQTVTSQVEPVGGFIFNVTCPEWIDNSVRPIEPTEYTFTLRNFVDSSGCAGVVTPATVDVWKRPETGPQYHIPNTYGE